MLPIYFCIVVAIILYSSTRLLCATTQGGPRCSFCETNDTTVRDDVNACPKKLEASRHRNKHADIINA